MERGGCPRRVRRSRDGTRAANSRVYVQLTAANRPVVVERDDTIVYHKISHNTGAEGERVSGFNAREARSLRAYYFPPVINKTEIDTACERRP